MAIIEALVRGEAGSSYRPEVRPAKRALDISLALVCGLLTIPLLFAIVVLIVLASPGRVIFAQTRVGLGGRPFKLWKFRTMVRNAEGRLAEYLTAHPELREEWNQTQKLRNDPRVTRVGRLLRKTSLDELPQLWNVLRGDMSLVGPRPIVSDEISRYGENFFLYTRVRPGFAGLWQVSGRNDTSYTQRVALDSYYVRHWSLWLDFSILARTVPLVLGRGAY